MITRIAKTLSASELADAHLNAEDYAHHLWDSLMRRYPQTPIEITVSQYGCGYLPANIEADTHEEEEDVRQAITQIYEKYCQG